MFDQKQFEETNDEVESGFWFATKKLLYKSLSWTMKEEIEEALKYEDALNVKVSSTAVEVDLNSLIANQSFKDKIIPAEKNI